MHTDESEATTSFLMQLSTWDKEELDEKLANRVQVSKRAVAKVIQAFDRLMQRNEKITLALKGELDGGIVENAPGVISAAFRERNFLPHLIHSVYFKLEFTHTLAVVIFRIIAFTI